MVNASTKTASFSNSSSGSGLSYFWRFGDGTTSSSINPSRTYANYGTYNVCLIVNNGINCVDSICTNVTISNACNANFSNYADSGNYRKIYFTSANTGSNITYQWSFGDSATSTLANPNHTYGGSGSYSVCLTVRKAYNGDTCVSYTCHYVVVALPPCHASFTYTVNQSTKTVYLNNTSTGTALFFNWKFGDNTTSTLASPVKTYSAAGSYNVCLKVYNSSSCIDSVCTTVTFSTTNSCEANFNFYTDSFNSMKVNYTSTNSGSNLTYHWDFGDSTTSSLKSPGHIYSHYGVFNVCLRITKAYNGDTCNVISCKTVNVVNPASLCIADIFFSTYVANWKQVFFGGYSQNPNLLYTWNFGDSSALGHGQYPSHTYASFGARYVCLSVVSTFDSTCQSTRCKLINVVDSGAICNAQFSWNLNATTKTVTFYPSGNNTSNITYSWNFGDSATSNQYYAYHVYTNGTYNVCLKVTKVSGNDTCVSQTCQTIIVGCRALYSYTIDPGNSLKVNLNNTSPGTGLTYYWTFGNGTTSTAKNPSVTYATAGTYTVCLTSHSSQDSTCNDTKCLSITVAPPPPCHAQFLFARDSSNALKVQFANTSTGDSLSYAWSFGDGLPGSTGKNPDHIFPHAGTYYVCLYINRSNPSCSSSYCDSVTVGGSNACAADFYFTRSPGLKIVAFTNISTGSHLRYEWSFGDSSFSNLKNPLHSYANIGVYMVCLYVFDSMNINCNDYVCHPVSLIAIGNNCTADFLSVRDTTNLGINKFYFIPYTNFGTSSTSFRWTFGDGDSSSSKTPDHIYAATGAYTVCLHVSNPGDSCDITHCDTLNVGTGMAERSNDLEGARFYPNPFDEQLNIELNLAHAETLNLSIYDITGREHYHTTLALNRNQNHLLVETAQLPKGVYLIRLSAGGNSTYKKLIK